MMRTGNLFYPLSFKNIWLTYQQFCLFSSSGLRWFGLGQGPEGGDAEVLYTEHKGGEQGPK